MIRFVTEDRGISDTEQDTRVISYGARGTGYIINGELAILTSLDLAQRVAKDVGPEEIVKDKQTTPSINAAAGMILKGLRVENPKKTNMISLSITHPDREIAQRILTSLIENYKSKHLEIHRGTGTFDEYITRETDQMRLRLQQTEQELNAVKSKANIFNISESKMRLSQSMTQIRQQTLQAQTEIAELETLIAQQEGQLERTPVDSSEEHPAVQPQNEFSESEMENAVREYASLTQKLDFLKNRERQLSLQYTDENSLLKVARKQIGDANGRLDELVRDYPGIRNNFAASIATPNSSDPNAPSIPTNLRESKLRLAAIQARLERLKALNSDLRKEASDIDSVEITLNELERRKALQESKYRSLLESMERARVQEELDDGRINNIGTIQAPSPAYVAESKRIQFAAGIGGGIMLIGLIWALLVDLLLDRSIKRPTEIQRNLGIPLFMSLPDLNDKHYRKVNAKANRHALQQVGRAKQLQAGKKKGDYKPKSPTLQAAALSKPEDYGSDNGVSREIAPWDDQHALNGHFDALRDKVITYFESKNLTHKPKLIAMTGLGQESGVTTIASGLAGSLSKIGEGNVLLVDMTLGHETAQQFYNGKNILNLDDVLERENESQAKVENNLYVVAEGTNGTKLPRIMPQRFNKIMPKLRASDFDYIIFDMPPVSPISSTPRLASFMDVVLMVMESEKTNRDVANQALELLADSKAHLGGILNKTKSHVPRKLEQDLLSQS